MGTFTISIFGLGLMGGSLCKALRGFRDCRIAGYDADAGVLDAALAQGAIDHAAKSVREAAEMADLLIFATSPHTILENVRESAGYLKPTALVTEICGVKQTLTANIKAALPEGVQYVGIHPMAGREHNGFAHSDADLFRGAGFIVIRTGDESEAALSVIRDMIAYTGAGRIVENTPEQHDALIAYTSDLMHISAAALCAKIPEGMTMAHTAGAFRDCTRVADLNPELWAELLTQNAQGVLPCLRQYIETLKAVEAMLKTGDSAALTALLARTTANKKEMLMQ